MTSGGPANATHLFATYAYQIGIGTGLLSEGAAIALAMFPILFPGRHHPASLHPPRRGPLSHDRRRKVAKVGVLLRPDGDVPALPAVSFLLDGDHFGAAGRRVCTDPGIPSTTIRSGPGIRHGTTSDTCSRRPCLHRGCGTQLSSRWCQPQSHSCVACSPAMLCRD